MNYCYTILHVSSGQTGVNVYSWKKKSQAVGFLNSLAWKDSGELDTTQVRGFAVCILLKLQEPIYQAEFEVS